MQLEEQNQVAVASEIPPQSESRPIKKQHGGKRPGAGRKPKAANIVLKGTTRATLLHALRMHSSCSIARRVRRGWHWLNGCRARPGQIERMASSEEMEALRLFRCPSNARKLVHRWRDRVGMPGVREVS